MEYTDILFVFALFPIYVILNFIASSNRTKNFYMLLVSMVFILFTRQWYYSFVLVAVLFTYLGGLILGKKPLKFVKLIVNTLNLAVLGGLSLLSVYSNDLILAFGLFMAFLRSASYLNEAEKGAEKDILSVGVYLISIEFLAISPIYKYSELKAQIQERKPTLAMFTKGLERFLAGITAVTVLSYGVLQLRAFVSNIALSVILLALQVVVTVSGYLSTSEGLMLLSGYKKPLENSCFMPKSLLSDGLGSLHPTLAEFLNSEFKYAKWWKLALLTVVSCAVAGVGIGFGFGILAFLGLCGACLLLQSLLRVKKSVATGIFSFISFWIGILLWSVTSTAGVPYNANIILSLAWTLIAVIYASPIKILAGAKLRQMMSTSKVAYAILRPLQVVFTALLPILSLIAMVGGVV